MQQAEALFLGRSRRLRGLCLQGPPGGSLGGRCEPRGRRRRREPRVQRRVLGGPGGLTQQLGCKTEARRPACLAAWWASGRRSVAGTQRAPAPRGPGATASVRGGFRPRRAQRRAGAGGGRSCGSGQVHSRAPAGT